MIGALVWQLERAETKLQDEKAWSQKMCKKIDQCARELTELEAHYDQMANLWEAEKAKNKLLRKHKRKSSAEGNCIQKQTEDQFATRAAPIEEEPQKNSNNRCDRHIGDTVQRGSDSPEEEIQRGPSSKKEGVKLNHSDHCTRTGNGG